MAPDALLMAPDTLAHHGLADACEELSGQHREPVMLVSLSAMLCE